ncbi:glycosyltransferase [Methylobacterium sp. NEAU K]|uniref:glycosyltransferase family 2 protein n=1 Tax=Methylobacterium sp. NEAU K TaxID=3064946 RepID=UPI0027360E69|nr:glycosyltransferase [Methylobacterium sp. NEAU K]MDP4006253.1 glycosyltransferase [Methylobacterium sp. NEAU K]
MIIAARNAEATIATAVASALRQPEVAEVIVVDDASEDRTSAAAEAAGDGSGRLKLLRLTRNAGPAAARNAALAAATSPLLCILDADDYFLDGRLGRLLAAPRTWDLIADDIVMVRGSAAAAAAGLVTGPGQPQRLSLAAFVSGNIGRAGAHRRELGFLKPIMRRAFLQRRGLRYNECLRLGEDYALYVEALAAGAVFVVTAPCGYVAIERSDSLSAQHRTEDLGAIVAFDEGMLARSGLEPGARHALRAHRDATMRKWQHRRVLDRRRTHGYAAALGELLHAPRAWRHIASETLKAKATRLLPTRLPDEEPGPRLLLGQVQSLRPAR